MSTAEKNRETRCLSPSPIIEIIVSVVATINSRVAQSLAVQRLCGFSFRDACDGGIVRGHVTAAAVGFVRHEKVEYIHLNPVKAGLVRRPDNWKWSSMHDYTGTVRAPAGAGSPIPVDRISLPTDPRTRI
jgi:hypothetical protein